jgi:hypothetical protein
MAPDRDERFFDVLAGRRVAGTGEGTESADPLDDADL